MLQIFNPTPREMAVLLSLRCVALWTRVAFNLKSSCLYVPSAEISGVCHHAEMAIFTRCSRSPRGIETGSRYVAQAGLKLFSCRSFPLGIWAMETRPGLKSDFSWSNCGIGNRSRNIFRCPKSLCNPHTVTVSYLRPESPCPSNWGLVGTEWISCWTSGCFYLGL